MMALMACDPIAGPVIVEALIPQPGARGGVATGDVTLEHVVDLRTGKSRDFDVRGDVKISVTGFNDLSGSFDDIVERTRGDDTPVNGQEVDARMSFDGTRYTADDYETFFYFTVMANFEAAFQAARDVGDQSRATNSDDGEGRALVALFGSLVLADLFPLPLISSDNAAYAPPADGWLALRSGLQDGVPLAMHRGVIAHEFGHRLVFHNTVTKVPGGLDVWRADVTRSELTDEQLRAQMLFKGLDEGLADVFAIAALESKDAINEAFAFAGPLFEAEALRRDVEGSYASQATYDNLRELELDATLLQDCGLTQKEFAVSFNFYCVGTVIAATLWEASGKDAAVLRAEMMPLVLVALNRAGVSLAAGTPFDLDLFFEPLVQVTSPGQRRDALCAALQTRAQSLVAGGRIPTCR